MHCLQITLMHSENGKTDIGRDRKLSGYQKGIAQSIPLVSNVFHCSAMHSLHTVGNSADCTTHIHTGASGRPLKPVSMLTPIVATLS